MQRFLFVTVLLGVACKIWATERCCPDIDCYNDGLLFLLFPLPQCPEDMDMSMKVYTRLNPTEGETITRDTIPSCFNGKVMTMFIVHGWLENEEYPWMHDMKDAALAQGDYNVIIVGWRGGADILWYPQPASNTRTVGGELALVVNNLINNGNSSKARMYCVGHSLGSHICGYAGQRVQFGRITGLDPAGPLFETADPSEGLNPSCADLVDVIHTNALVGIGILRPVGHVDFYANGGIVQPGCISDSVTELLKWPSDYLSWTKTEQDASFHLVLVCSHLRAYDYFTESIRKPGFIARFHCLSPPVLPVLPTLLCPKNAIQSMGFYANTYSDRGIFYLETNSVPPYSRG